MPPKQSRSRQRASPPPDRSEPSPSGSSPAESSLSARQRKESGKLKQGTVSQRAPPQHVERDVVPSSSSVVQQVPPMRLTTPSGDPLPPAVVAAALRQRAAPPVVAKKKKRGAASSAVRGVLGSLRSYMFAREDFEEARPARSHSEMTESQQRLLTQLNGLKVPGWMRDAIFEFLDFFSKRRVQVVMFLVLAILLLSLRAQIIELFGGVSTTFTVQDEDRPGLTFFDKFNGGSRTLPHKHPVVIIPGFITGALELWEANAPCLRNLSITPGFRERMFGPQMIYLILRDPQCWIELFEVEKEKGMDKDHIKVRADSGFASVDYFVPGYWVWAKVLINLADIGYDPQSLAVMTYDWRLSPASTHMRDGFFYSVRGNIKFMCQKNRQRSVLISHSYGTTVALAFLKWTEEREPGFMNRYIAYYVNIGGTAMGLPKALSGILMGDVKDTVSIPRPARRLLEAFLSQSARYNLTRTYSCLSAMLPRGCDDLYPNVLSLDNGTVLSIRGASELVMEECERTGHLDCVRHVRKHLETIDDLPVLPHAPNSTVMCFYGVKKMAEVGYHIENSGGSYVANMSYFDNTTNYGVTLGDGDGTVPLMSLAYMCRASNGWRQNVGRVVTIEHKHDLETVSPLDLRGGSISGDHVDILGNYGLLENILKIASGIDGIATEDGIGETIYTDPATGNTTLLQHSLKDRLHSDVDEVIETKMQNCLNKENIPIKPIPISDDREKEFL